MRLLAVGLSHRTAPVELRERVDFARAGLESALVAIAARGLGAESVVLATCNRAEVYALAESEDAAEAIARFFSEYHAIDHGAIGGHLYVHKGAGVARHLFRVAAGLDSLVVGEPQVLGQVKRAYAVARERHFTGAVTNRLFHSAFSVGKRVRSETALGEGAVSVSYAAIGLARKIFGELKGLEALILGAGEMAKLTGIHLQSQDVNPPTIVSRTITSSVGLARQVGGRAVSWDDLATALEAADIVVTATGAAEPVLRRDQMERVMRQRRRRPLFVIDIALPRDVEPSVGDLDQVFLYNIDDLQSIVRENLARRSDELSQAEAIVEEEVNRFVSWLQSREVVPTVVALRQRFDAIRRSELERLAPKLAALPPDVRERVDEVTRLIVEKLLLLPTEQLKSVSDETLALNYADALNRLFSLSAERSEEPVPAPGRAKARIP